ncbi:MAG TPA: alpha/beta fold hydrolase [Solirubrobacteraceae bacterium]|jgi:pimeloyl-ACP methyl ester carboxylesterase|nr:alpha/beta fold hydrolase [Solirubrobacteraceae bacterium]
MSLVRVGEIELDFERSGAGPPLLAIMGMSGTALHWGEPFLAALREHFEVIVYDHRGVGRSSRLEGSVTIAQMAADAAGLLGAIELDSAHVLGISMGGMVAQELALEQPELVRTLTLGCTYCGGEGSSLTAPEVMQRLTEAMMSGDRPRALRVGWEINVSAGLVDDAAAYERFLAVAEEYAVAVPVVMAQAQACMAQDTRARLAGLSMPTLVIHGTEDEMLPVGNGRLIASRIPGARLEILDGVGHLFFWEQPERAAELIAEHAAVHA